VIILFFLGLWLLGFVFWIVSIIEVCRIPDQQYRIAGAEKVAWILVVALAGWIGALIWRLGPRRRVVSGQPDLGYGIAAPTTAAGWYPDPSGGGQMRWWDGYRWTDASR
jgi:hypothetical protein